jgi:hypothetical protein
VHELVVATYAAQQALIVGEDVVRSATETMG